MAAVSPVAAAVVNTVGPFLLFSNVWSAYRAYFRHRRATAVALLASSAGGPSDPQGLRRVTRRLPLTVGLGSAFALVSERLARGSMSLIANRCRDACADDRPSWPSQNRAVDRHGHRHGAVPSLDYYPGFDHPLPPSQCRRRRHMLPLVLLTLWWCWCWQARLLALAAGLRYLASARRRPTLRTFVAGALLHRLARPWDWNLSL